MSCHGYEGVISVLCTPLQVKCYQNVFTANFDQFNATNWIKKIFFFKQLFWNFWMFNIVCTTDLLWKLLHDTMFVHHRGDYSLNMCFVKNITMPNLALKCIQSDSSLKWVFFCTVIRLKGNSEIMPWLVDIFAATFEFSKIPHKTSIRN